MFNVVDSCKRDFYPIPDNERQKSILDIQSDLEAVGSESGSGSSSPVLLSSEEDLRFFPESRKKKDYLADHFPNATIETREYIPG